MQRPANDFLSAVSCCAFGDEFQSRAMSQTQQRMPDDLVVRHRRKPVLVVTKRTAGRSEAKRGGAKHGEAVARRCGTADGASKKRTQQPRPCGRNTFITTSYAPRPDWPVVRDTLSHLLLHTPRRRKETRDKDDTHTNTHGSRSQNKTTSDRDAQQGSASIDTG